MEEETEILVKASQGVLAPCIHIPHQSPSIDFPLCHQCKCTKFELLKLKKLNSQNKEPKTWYLGLLLLELLLFVAM
jgi:hypothetical protein